MDRRLFLKAGSLAGLIPVLAPIDSLSASKKDKESHTNNSNYTLIGSKCYVDAERNIACIRYVLGDSNGNVLYTSSERSITIFDDCYKAIWKPIDVDDFLKIRSGVIKIEIDILSYSNIAGYGVAVFDSYTQQWHVEYSKYETLSHIRQEQYKETLREFLRLNKPSMQSMLDRLEKHLSIIN